MLVVRMEVRWVLWAGLKDSGTACLGGGGCLCVVACVWSVICQCVCSLTIVYQPGEPSREHSGRPGPHDLGPWGC